MKKVKIYTNLEKTFEAEPNPHDEVEQRLSINAGGRVQFSSSLYGGGYGHYKKGRREEITITPETAQQIFDEISRFFATQPVYNIIPGFGLWEMSIVLEHNKSKQYFGVTSGVYSELTHFIERRVPIEHLMVFK